MVIEVEIRSFITPEEYKKFIAFFTANGKLINKDFQETYYFNAKEDLRIQRNDFFSKIWLKKGKLHDEAREEIEIKFAREDFSKLESLFLALGFKVEIKWFRLRHTFEWKGISVMVDYTKGYGHILELEKLCSDKEKASSLALLKKRMKELHVKKTPKQEFDKKYNYYKENWKTLTSS
jgi:predicted adenylyl cyclase CyaB